MSQRESIGTKRYWPFPVQSVKISTGQDQSEIRFLQTAYEEGFSPYEYPGTEFGATTESRGGLIVRRGRGKWELKLGTIGDDPFCIPR